MRANIGISVIIIIALGLVVLLISSVFFVSETNNTRQNIESCDLYNAECMGSVACNSIGGRAVRSGCQQETQTQQTDVFTVETIQLGGSVCCVR